MVFEVNFEKIFVFSKRVILYVWKFFIGGMIAFVTFISLFHDFKSPDVIIEITSITTTSSEPIDLVKIPELYSLKELITPEDGSDVNKYKYSNEIIERKLLIQENDLIEKQKSLDETERKLNEIVSNKDGNTFSALQELTKSSFLSGDFLFSSTLLDLSLESNTENKNTKKEITEDEKIDKQINQIKEAVKSTKKTLNADLVKFSTAKKQWENYKNNILPNKSKILITCAIGNNGSGATSLKPQALLRANLSEGNYLDIPMIISSYNESSELASLQTQSYKIIKFQSAEFDKMSPADSERIKMFLGNVSPATLYISDVRGNNYKSNSVPFSPGIYEQKIYDKLKQFALSDNHI